jgi:hypothetical protein
MRTPVVTILIRVRRKLIMKLGTLKSSKLYKRLGNGNSR